MGEHSPRTDQSSVIPLILGVIGPRDIAMAQAKTVAGVVSSVLPSMSEAFPHSDVVLLTSVAAGTDTVAAQAAHDLGYPVYALLPLEEDDYALDFSDSKMSLQDRLALTRGRWVSPATQYSSRDAHYQSCGRLLARLSSTLLVAWDGSSPAKPGGTSDTLFYAVPGAAALTDLSGGPSTLTTERGDVVTFAPGDSTSVVRRGAGMSTERWDIGEDSVSTRIDRFNRESGPSSNGGSTVLGVEEAADALATRLQARYRRWTLLLLALGVLALVSVDIQVEISQAWFLGLQVIALVVVLGTWWALNRAGIKRRFEEYRALAEGARVQHAWQRAGVNVPVSDHYLQPLGSEGFWIRRVLRTAWLMDLVRPVGAPRVDPAAAREWVDGQILYFEGSSSRPGAIRRNQSKAARMRLLAWALVGLALLGLVPDVARYVLSVNPSESVMSAARLAWGFGTAAAAATVAYSQLMGYSRSAKRGRLSLEMYRQARIDLESAESSEAAQQRLVFDLGREALRETGDWLVMNTSQSIRPV